MAEPALALHQEGFVSRASPLNEQAAYLRHVLEVASAALSRVPSLVEDFSEAPNSLEDAELHVPPALSERVAAYGVVPGAQAAPPGGNVPTLAEAPWRDQVPRRPALPAATRLWLPTEFHVQSTTGERLAARPGYNYFHGNLVFHGMYLATQAPPVRRVRNQDVDREYDARADFWLAVRQSGARCIVMLAAWSEGHAVRPYLPLHNGDQPVAYYIFPGAEPPPVGSYPSGAEPPGWCIRATVRLLEAQHIPARDIDVRRLSVEFAVRDAATGRVVRDAYVHHVQHVHYYAWPDGGIPTRVEALLGLASVASGALLGNTPNEPTVVHCLAGHGRTGTLLTALAAVRSWQRNGEATLTQHLLNNFYALRKERFFMVQNSLQLLYAHACFAALLAARQRSSGPSAAPLIVNVAAVAGHIGAAPAGAARVCVRCLNEAPTVRDLVRVDSLADGTTINFCSAACARRFVREQWPAAAARLTPAI